MARGRRVLKRPDVVRDLRAASEAASASGAAGVTIEAASETTTEGGGELTEATIAPEASPAKTTRKRKKADADE